jgi:hypothetical protein
MATAEAPATPKAAEVLVRESRLRPWAGAAAIGAAILAFVAGFLPQSIYSSFPPVYFTDALRDAAGESIGRPGLRTAQVLFIHDKAVPLLAVAVAQAIASLLIGVVLVFLFDAATARGATTPRFARPLAVGGAIGAAIGALLTQIAVMIAAADFASSGDHGTKAAHDALHGGGVVAGSAIGLFSGLALAGAFVMISVGAMRVGLLTRFVGILGAIVGVLFVLGAAMSSSTFIIQTFWLLMMGFLLLGRWPTGVPRAWATGEAAPWPSQQELREARERSRGGSGARGTRARPATPAEPPAAPEARAEAPSPATSARKKRKRRS